jgi:hypothetical protein
MEIKETSKKSKTRMPADKYDEALKKMRREHEKPCKGMFEFTEAQGGWLDFCYRIFPGESLKTIRLIHGEICELPMGIVKHLNNTKKKVRKIGLNPIEGRGGELPERGLPSTFSVESRVRFTPMEAL